MFNIFVFNVGCLEILFFKTLRFSAPTIPRHLSTSSAWTTSTSKRKWFGRAHHLLKLSLAAAPTSKTETPFQLAAVSPWESSICCQVFQQNHLLAASCQNHWPTCLSCSLSRREPMEAYRGLELRDRRCDFREHRLKSHPRNRPIFPQSDFGLCLKRYMVSMS